MLNDARWIEAAIAKAKRHSVAVPDGVWTTVETLLKGKLSERPLPATELARVANQLIDAIKFPPLEIETLE
jgi:hypothetical protein